MVDVLLVTSNAWPDGEPGGSLLLEAFEARGITAAWAVWDDETVDWTAAQLVALRSTWDYHERFAEFMEWLVRIEEAGARVLNGVDVVRWNTDKAYLVELAEAGVPVVPTLLAEGEEDLPSAIAEFGTAVVKPRTAAGGRGVVVFDMTEGGPADLDESRLEPGPWVVQPLVESIHDEGEWSVYVLGGRAVSAARKVPGAGEIRVHEHFGGRTDAAELGAEQAEVALRTVAGAESLLGRRLPYARVDQMRLADGTLAVSELEATEPGLYLDVLPQNAAWFADAVADELG
ncbi:ATP-grasp domain-containing protein [Nocardioides sp. Bht2]|uniref:ATP-grasp domain-containing protein n=1 Tax=Nocardioides sp. Bht2 TaxID=3392297 RepID=UPI0039B4CC31